MTDLVHQMEIKINKMDKNKKEIMYLYNIFINLKTH